MEEAVIIFGGSFDPIHNGHLRIARAASMSLNADVIFVPQRTLHWKTAKTTPQQRLDMLRLALKKEGSPSFGIDLFEMKSKSEKNYSIDLVRHIALTYRGRKIYLLIGADQVNDFPKWKDPDEICRLATPLFVPRPNVEIDDSVLERFPMVRLPFDGSGEVSSTKVRSLQDMDIPLCVRDYIEANGLYYMATLEAMMSHRRLVHSISVANLAYLVARKNRLDHPTDAYVAGLVHDCAKELKKEDLLRIMKEQYPQYADYPQWTYHQFAGAFTAKAVFGITNERILDAVMFHASGKAHMSPLGKIIYACDKIEPTRGFDSQKLIDACCKQYYTGFVNVLDANREYLASKGHTVDNPSTKECFDLYLGGNR